ncbi:MAG: type I-C CRISPR-associated endonuclease Cas1 [Thermoguttaceae bacterium]|nr:type I-C CRISPR-associated endonuclease Cas1 [Thermoguttaceae bacterium]
MKRFGNTVYVTTQKIYVRQDGTNLVFSLDGKEVRRLPIHTLDGVVAFGAVSWSPFALGLCAENGVAVSMLTENGKFLARVVGPQSGNVLLRRAQHRRTTAPETAAEAARAFVSAKIANARVVLQRAVRDRGAQTNVDALERAAQKLSRSIFDLTRSPTVAQIRGVEGDAARTYFSVFNELIVAQKHAFVFRERSRRPPLDPINALLSFLYVLLAHDLRSACEAVGLDPQLGFLHADRSGRASLALDLTEEFRPWLADRLALSLINRRQIDPRGFERSESGAVVMSDATRKTVLTAWQERKRDELQHPFLGEKVPIGLLPLVQARLLAKWLRGELDAYPAFFWK